MATIIFFDHLESICLCPNQVLYFGKLSNENELEWIINSTSGYNCSGSYESVYIYGSLLTDDALYFSLYTSGSSLDFSNGQTVLTAGDFILGFFCKFGNLYYTFQVSYKAQVPT